jgi:hypothetical protein
MILGRGSNLRQVLIPCPLRRIAAGLSFEAIQSATEEEKENGKHFHRYLHSECLPVEDG